MARWLTITTFLLVVPAFVGTPVRAAQPAGKSVSINIGYLSALGDHTTIAVQGITTSFAADNIFVGATVEAPLLWKSLYPVASARWFFGSRYDIDDEIENRFWTRGFLLCAGLGYGLDAWQATLRLQAAGGYWWEDMNVDYSGFFQLESFTVANDEPALLLAASLAFPFASRLDALVSCELLMRAQEEVSGSFENGRWYRIETNGTHGTVSIGLALGLGPN